MLIVLGKPLERISKCQPKRVIGYYELKKQLSDTGEKSTMRQYVRYS
jgi:hypothetical protein